MIPTLLSPSMGNDPELFVKMGNRIIPAEKILVKQHKSIKIDNAAIELQPGPKECLQEQNKEIAKSLAVVRNVLKASEFSKAHISLRPVEQLRTEDIDNFRSVCLFGCQPSLIFDGQNLRISKPNVNPRKVKYRSVGYHVHVGSERPEYFSDYNYASDSPWLKQAQILHTTEGRVRLVQMCDLFVGLPAVLLERDSRVPIRRQTLGYGQAGEFREQPHGFEYRTLGSWPLLHPMWGWWANAAVRDALHFVVYDQDQDLKKNIDLAKVAEVINTNNLAGALELWQQVKRNLEPIYNWWHANTDADARNDSHPLISKNNLQLFEFLAANKILNRKVFSFQKWCRRIWDYDHYKPTAFFDGFPNAAYKVVSTMSGLDSFCSEWAWDRDLISKPLLA